MTTALFFLRLEQSPQGVAVNIWPTVVAIVALAVALGIIVVIHRLVATHGSNPLLALEVVAFTLIASGIVLAHLGELYRTVMAHGRMPSFGWGDGFLILGLLLASYVIYLVAKWLDAIIKP